MTALATPFTPLTLLATRVTPEELLAMPDNDLKELVNGRVVEKNMSQESSWVGGELLRRMGNHVVEHNLGWVFGADCGYQCFAPRRPKRVRKPDVSFVSKERLPERRFQLGFVKIAPDLAAEVVSPNDDAEDLRFKVEEYLFAGVKRVWVVYPRLRIVDVHLPTGAIQRMVETESLVAEEVLPGFRCPISDILPLPPDEPYSPPSDE